MARGSQEESLGGAPSVNSPAGSPAAQPSSSIVPFPVPESPAGGVSEGGSVITAAGEEAKAQQLRRKSEQMAFLRTRQKPEGAFEAGDKSAMPMEIKNKPRDNPKAYEFYLQRWIDCNRDYGKVMVFEKIAKRHSTLARRKRGWRTRSQLKGMGYTDEEV